jgi:competence protein ComEC
VRHRQVGDAAMVALAAATWAGALVARPVPLAAAVAALAAGWVTRRPVLLVVGGALVASGLAARAWAGLAPPRPQTVSATVTLVSDPVVRSWGATADVRWRGVRLEARAAPGPVARGLARRLAGERVLVTGVVSPLDAARARWLAPRHVVGRLEVIGVGAWSPGTRLAAAANRLRHLLTDGASSLPPAQRALFTGLVIGDDRGQDPASREAFRAAGLSHLLAVSGGNVAFVLALVRPLLRWLPLAGRTLAALGVLAAFGVLTRWEPSVLRAEAMAAAALLAAWRGRPQPGVRLLALAVSGLLLVDPLLAWSLGFRLSVAASAGIVLLARPLADRLPGPRALADAVAVTVAAQVGVAPVLVPTFGPLPLAAVPANLLAGPAAGLVMGWGLAAGLAAGVLAAAGAGGAAWLLHRPTAVLVGWVDLVARVGAAAPLPRVGLPVIGVAALAALVGPALRRSGARRRRGAGRGPPAVG